MEIRINRNLRKFIVDSLLFGDDRFAFSDDDSFQERGIVDSTGILELVAHVEETYGIHVTDDELVPANFDSIARLVRFVERKQASMASLASSYAH